MFVVYGWTWVGFAIETYGFWVLFKGFIPNVLQFSRRIPMLGKVLDLPFLKTVSQPAIRTISCIIVLIDLHLERKTEVAEITVRNLSALLIQFLWLQVINRFAPKQTLPV